MTKELTDVTFPAEVEQSKKVVLVDFWAPWCGPCKVQGPIVQSISEQYASNQQVTIAKLNVDENPLVGQKYGILSIPTLKIFKNGMVVEDMIGLQSKENLLSRLARHVT